MSGRRTAEDVSLPGGNFRLFIQRLGLIGLQSLGLIENPLTGEKRVHRANARMTIDDLRMLREKTRGNLDPDEARHLDELIAELERAFAATEAAGADTSEGPAARD